MVMGPTGMSSDEIDEATYKPHPDEPRKLRPSHPSALILRKHLLAFLRRRPNATDLIHLQNL